MGQVGCLCWPLPGEMPSPTTGVSDSTPGSSGSMSSLAMASSPGSPRGISQVWRNSLKLRRLLLYFCGPKLTPRRPPQRGLSDSWMDHAATPQGHALLRAPRILSVCP